MIVRGVRPEMMCPGGPAMKFKRIGRLLSVAAVLLLLCSGLSAGAGATLHEQSLGMLAKRVAAADPDDWCFVFMGDNRGNDKKFKAALQLAASLKPLFILHGGDVGERGTSEELIHFRETVSSLPGLPPLFVVRGNHEMDAGLFERIIGPLNFTLDDRRLGFRLVAVDNADYTLRGKELAYLGKMLDNSRENRFVAMHIPPQTERWGKHSFVNGKDELAGLLAERQVKLGLFAHIHLFDKDVINGVPAVISGGAGAQLAYFGYSGIPTYHVVVVEIRKGKVSFRSEEVY